MDIDPVVHQLGPQAVGKAADCEFGAAINRLQRHRAIGERRADLGAIDPDIDRAEMIFDTLGCSIDRIGIGHVEGQSKRFAAALFDLGLEPLGSARDQRHLCAAACVLARPSCHRREAHTVLAADKPDCRCARRRCARVVRRRAPIRLPSPSERSNLLASTYWRLALISASSRT
jgi:hypothetical protein